MSPGYARCSLTALARLSAARRLRSKLLIGSGLAACALVAVALALLLTRSANAWTQVAQALKGLPWVHIRTLGPDGKEAGQAWFSPKNGVSAVRHGPQIEYHDQALKTFTKYVPDEEVIYRLPEIPDQNLNSIEFIQHLLDPKGPTKAPLPGLELIAQSRRDLVEDGRDWAEIDLTFRVVGSEREQKMRFRVDPRTKRPYSLVYLGLEELEATTLFDYPDRGPADIYDLGVPRNREGR